MFHKYTELQKIKVFLKKQWLYGTNLVLIRQSITAKSTRKYYQPPSNLPLRGMRN